MSKEYRNSFNVIALKNVTSKLDYLEEYLQVCRPCWLSMTTEYYVIKSIDHKFCEVILCNSAHEMTVLSGTACGMRWHTCRYPFIYEMLVLGITGKRILLILWQSSEWFLNHLEVVFNT